VGNVYNPLEVRAKQQVTVTEQLLCMVDVYLSLLCKQLCSSILRALEGAFQTEALLLSASINLGGP
jgi:hypothetical protein